MNRKAFGDLGETVAANYLAGLGYTILDRNYRAMGTELDIIARDGAILVFVEVKSRSSVAYGHGFEAVDERKVAHIVQTSLDYIQRHGLSHMQVRYDIVEYYKNGELNHIRNAIEL
ncbi:YraN family protein [Peptoniphilus equinus]|uniref:UPF0102 protein O6R05_06845 n=1 Tax=Peptoniphilus equinus TaxID=3016343 RepID=A0ABY7QSE3_9FIRM|nr:YraN family protein [Peptoniphilus equinus]WBW49713.1 YraN family protein [Peptoniphilus equinus]